MRARLLEATVELPGRARLRRYVDHAGLRAGRGEPRRPAAPLPDQERPGGRRRRAPDRGPRRRAGGGRRAAADRAEADPRRAADARRPLHLAGLHRRARALGGGPHRRDPARGGRAARAAGRPRDPPADRRAARRRRVAARRARAGAGHARPGPRARPRQHRSPTTPAGASRILDQWAHTLDDALEARDERPARRACSTDLDAEGDQLWRPSCGLDDDGWATPTPAAGLDLATQVAHLLWTDEVAVLAAHRRRRGQGGVGRRRRWQAIADPDRLRRRRRLRGRRAAPRRRCSPAGAPAASALADALRELPRRARRCRGSARRCRRRRWRPRGSWRPGRTRSTSTTRSAIDARAHRPDPARRPPRRPHPQLRLRRARLEPPAEEFRVELTAPSGEIWAWGPEDAAQRVTGSAYDFCLLVTQRIHRDDTDLVRGRRRRRAVADIAQAFAGPPGDGREAAHDRLAADRQLLRLLRRPALRDARDARGRRRSTCSPATTSPS